MCCCAVDWSGRTDSGRKDKRGRCATGTLMNSLHDSSLTASGSNDCNSEVGTEDGDKVSGPDSITEDDELRLGTSGGKRCR